MSEKFTEVTKGQLAEKIGKSSAIVTRLIRSGVLDGCLTTNGKKVYLEKAIRAIILNKGSDYIKVDTGITVEAPSEVQGNAELFTAENIEELQTYLDMEPSPSKKIEMMDKFWSFKIRRQKFMEAEGDLIPVADAKAAFEALIGPLNQYLDDQANNLKNHFPDLPDEIVEWLTEENNRQKEQLRNKEWED